MKTTQELQAEFNIIAENAALYTGRKLTKQEFLRFLDIELGKRAMADLSSWIKSLSKEELISLSHSYER